MVEDMSPSNNDFIYPLFVLAHLAIKNDFQAGRFTYPITLEDQAVIPSCVMEGASIVLFCHPICLLNTFLLVIAKFRRPC